MQLTRQTSLKFEMEYRYGDHAKKLFYKHYEGEILTSTRPYLMWGLGYRQVYHRTVKHWKEEYYPFGDMIFHFTRRRWTFMNRSRLVYRILPSHHNRWLYRNRTTLITPWIWTRFRWTPYIADEFFWLEGHGVHQNRILAGFLFPFHKKIQGDLFYQRRALKTRDKEWIHQNMVGIYLSFFF